MAFCPNCSAQLAPAAVKCEKCGAEFGDLDAWKPTAVPVHAAKDWTAIEHLVAALVGGLILVVLAWAVSFAESPFYQWMLAYPRLREFVGDITMPALFLVVMSSGSGHGGGGGTYLGGVFVEGAILGALFWFAVSRIAGYGKKRTET